MQSASRFGAAAAAALAARRSIPLARSLATAPFDLKPGPFLKRDLEHPAHTALLLDGTAAAAAWTAELAVSASVVAAARGGRPPGLAVVLVGDRPDSALYALRKREACARAGVAATLIHLPESASQAAVNGAVRAAGRDPAVDGVLLQLPLPPHLDAAAALTHLPQSKDVDGALPSGLGALLARGHNGGGAGDEPWAAGAHTNTAAAQPFIPCTALGAAALLGRAGLWGPAALGGASAVLVGDSATVGLPLAALLRGCGVGSTTLVHRSATAALFCEEEGGRGGGGRGEGGERGEGGGGGGHGGGDRAAAGACLPSPTLSTTTGLNPPSGDRAAALEALAARVRGADVLVAAVGAAGAIRGGWLKPGCLVLDVGINVVPDPGAPGGYRVVGDVCPSGAGETAAAVTPVPGGLGPMTIAALLHNTVAAAAASAGMGPAASVPSVEGVDVVKDELARAA